MREFAAVRDRRARKRIATGILVVAIASALVLLVLPVADDNSFPEEVTAPDDAPSILGLKLIGRTPLQTPNADVWAHNGYAYVGTWSTPCSATGVKIVDVRDPALPRQIGSLAAYENTSAEDVVVISVDTPRFKGDLLAVGLQPCNPSGFAGLDLWDVTDPVRPNHAAFFYTGPGGVHELSMIQRASDGRVLALLAVPYSEASNLGGDLKIVDVADPYLPVLASSWGVVRERGHAPTAGSGAMPTEYDHSALPSPDGMTAYVSYWDAGVQILDIRDPERPRFVGRTWYPEGAEGNAHSIAIVPERNLLIQADEDFDYRTPMARILAPGELVGNIVVVEAAFGPRVSAENRVNGTLIAVGRGCANDTYPVANITGAVVMATRGDCTFTEKAIRAQNEGAIALVVANNEPGPATAMGGADPNVTIPAVMIDMDTATRLNSTNETVVFAISPETVSYNPWGTLRFFDVSDPGRPQQVAEYATPHARNEPAPEDGGRYSVHNPVWLPEDSAVIASWFSDGVRIIHLHGDTPPHEIASWLPPADAPQPPDVWGVYVDGDIVYASDMQYGLWVLEIVRTP